MNTLKLKKIQLLEKLSENPLTQSWIGVDKSDNRNIFLKFANPESHINPSNINSILKRSYRCQSKFKHSSVHSVTEKFIDNKILFYKYHYLNPDEWELLTPDIFITNFKEILLQICSIIDFIHLKGFVHADIKLNNFFFVIKNNKPIIKLIDLDFLCPTGTSPEGLIVGTPNHIAPEIISNEILTHLSDNYSLGIALNDVFEHFLKNENNHKIHSININNLKKYIENLTQKAPIHRPYSLLNSLLQHQLIESKEFLEYQKKLLVNLLFSSFRLHRNSSIENIKHQLFDRNKIVGINNELCDDLQTSYSKNPLKTFRIFKKIIESAEINQYGEYWHIKSLDNILIGIYKELSFLKEFNLSSEMNETIDKREDVKKYLSISINYFKKKNYLKSSLSFKSILMFFEINKLELEPSTYCTILKYLGDIATIENKLNEAVKYYQKHIEFNKNHLVVDLEVLYQLISLHFMLGQNDNTVPLINSGLAQAQKKNDSKFELKYLRLQSWLMIIQGNYNKSFELLNDILERSEAVSDLESQVETYYIFGAHFWQQGIFGKAKSYLLKGFEIASANNLLSKSIHALYSLCLIYFETGDYGNSIKFGKLANSNIEDIKDHLKIPLIFCTIANSYTRLGKYSKAEYWGNKIINSTTFEFSPIHFIMFYNCIGYNELNRSNFDRAIEYLFRANELSSNISFVKFKGKNLQNIAYIFLIQGHSEYCNEYIDKAIDLYKSIKDKASYAEAKSIKFLNEYYKSEDNNLSNIIDNLKALVDLKCYYYAVQTLVHLMLNVDKSTLKLVLNIAKPLLDNFKDSEAPLFKVFSILVNMSEEIDNKSLLLERYKSIYKILHEHNKFLSILVCIKIGELYVIKQNSRLAVKFFQQALDTTNQIKNISLPQLIENRISELSQHSNHTRDVINSIYKISDILMDVNNYEDALDHIVEFALQQTGAERGVLFIKNDINNKYTIKSSINCDDNSIKDIIDFSSNVPFHVIQNVDPLIVDNALTDKRTKNYKSIVLHNILSIICLPIIKEEKILGALYLDHHTIPGLFRKDDIAYISSLINFIAIIMSTLQNYRNISIINKQLINDVKQSKKGMSFITSDSKLLDMFRKLPEIARSNAPILITGESGTGKEILAETIHNLSLRADKPLIKLNSTVLAKNLVESELFGIEKKVASDVDQREGKLSAADGGSFFFDEISDMTLELQGKILRVVEYQEFEKVGSNRTIYTDIRFIYATNKNLQELIKNNIFRLDLYHRISTLRIEIPPLCERKEDIGLLVDHFIEQYTVIDKKISFNNDAMKFMLMYEWPGNVRELKNIIERFCILYPGQCISPNLLPIEIQNISMNKLNNKKDFDLIEKEKIKESLIRNKWIQSNVSKELKIPLSTLRRKIIKYNIIK